MKRFTNTNGEFMILANKYIKRPNPVHMLQIDEEFEVETAEGIMHGSSGDYLVYDPLSGHVWPITAEYKEMHYDNA